MTPLIRLKALKILGLLIVSGCGPAWVPSGGVWNPRTDVGCQESVWADSIRREANPSERLKLMVRYFERCGESQARDDNGGVELIIRASSIAYLPETVRGVYRVRLRERSGRQVEGLLAMKSSPVPRPLVIVKCGLQCGLGSSSLLQSLMHLFDEGPFHVLLLPSTSAEEVQLQTGNVVVGGYDEGRQILDLAKLLQSPDFSESLLITNVHVLGLSLGGHAALYAALYGSFDLRPSGQPWIRSVLAACPVVDLQDSVESLYAPTLLGTFAFDRFWNQFLSLVHRIPLLGEVMESGNNTKLRNVADILAKTSVRYFQKMQSQPSWSRAPFENVLVQDAEDFWRLNDFSRFADMLRIPVFVWAARDDIVVSTAKNTERLIGTKSASRAQIHALITDHGNHCAFSGAYGWRLAGSILRSSILAESPEWRQKNERIRIPQLSRVGTFRPETRGFEFRAQSDGRFEFRSYEFDRTCTQPSCERVRSVWVPMERLGISRAHWPLNQAEREMMTRRLNANVDIWPAGASRWSFGMKAEELEWISTDHLD